MKTRNILLVSAGVVLLFAAVGYLLVPKGGVQDDLKAERFGELARRLVVAGPAAEGHPSKDAVQKLIEDELARTGARVKALPFTAELPGHGSVELVNVVGSFRPEAKLRLLLGTHWDTRPWADEDPDETKRGEPIVGANDGVSGVAVLLEIARALGERPLPTELGVDVVFFDGEEGPKGTDAYFLGSKRLAEHWFELGLAPPSLGVVVDMVGKKGLRIRREDASDQLARTVNDSIFRIARERNATVFVDEVGKRVSDDHVAFMRRGIPVALLIDMNYPEWHTTADTLDKVDPEAMRQTADVVLAWVREEAKAAVDSYRK